MEDVFEYNTYIEAGIEVNIPGDIEACVKNVMPADKENFMYDVKQDVLEAVLQVVMQDAVMFLSLAVQGWSLEWSEIYRISYH